MNTRHAVVNSGYYTGLHLEEIPFRAADFSLDQLCQVALDNQLTHLWITPDAGITPGKEWFNAHDEAAWSLLDNWKYHNIEPPPGEQNLLKSVTGFRRGGGQKQITLCFLGQASWSWAHDPALSPQSLLEVISRLEYDLGVPVATSASTAGMRYLKATLAHMKHEDWLKPPEGIPLAELPWNDSAKNLIWHRDLTDGEYQEGKWIHKVDVNGAFLRACVEEMFGGALIVHTGRPTLEDIKKPGIWNILLREDQPVDHPLLPSPLWTFNGLVASPVLKLLAKMGYEVDILEGWFFPECHGTLKRWAENLWKFRQAAKGWPALHNSYKEIYTSTLGLTRSDKIAEEGSFKFRPDINAQVVAGARAAMMYRIMKYAAMNIYPVMCYIDSLLYVSPYPAVGFALPGILDHEHSLGGFKHEWTIPLTAAVREVLASSLPRAKKLEWLNAFAAHQEAAI